MVSTMIRSETRLLAMIRTGSGASLLLAPHTFAARFSRLSLHEVLGRLHIQYSLTS